MRIKIILLHTKVKQRSYLHFCLCQSDALPGIWPVGSGGYFQTGSRSPGTPQRCCCFTVGLTRRWRMKFRTESRLTPPPQASGRWFLPARMCVRVCVSIVGSSPAVAVQESLSLHIQTQPSYWSATGIMGWNPHQLVVVVTAEWVWVVQANLLWDVSWLLFTSPLMFRWIHDGVLASTFPCRSHTVVGLDGGFGWLSR